MGMGERRYHFGLACLLAMVGGLPTSVVSGTVSVDPAPTLTNALGMTFRMASACVWRARSQQRTRTPRGLRSNVVNLDRSRTTAVP
jgi:hypothetical protein